MTGVMLVLMMLIVFMFIFWIALTRWLFRINDLHKEFVRIRSALESMDKYIVGTPQNEAGGDVKVDNIDGETYP